TIHRPDAYGRRLLCEMIVVSYMSWLEIRSVRTVIQKVKSVGKVFPPNFTLRAQPKSPSVTEKTC
ncbi:MAG: hypothetical protein ACREOI_14700, partial [bacterium]